MKVQIGKTGALLMIASAFFFSAMQVLIKITGDRIPLMEQVFFRNFVCMVICYLVIKKYHLTFFGEKKYQLLLLIRSNLALLATITLFYAASHANQADVTILNKLSPFLITLYAYLFLKEKIAKIQIPALIIAFSGAFLVTNSKFDSSIFPLLMSLLSALFLSVSHTMLAYFKDKVSGMTIVMHVSTCCVVVSIPFMMINFVLPDFKDTMILLLMGFLGSLGQFAIAYAYRMTPASEVSVYNYTGIIFSMILGYVILGETVSLSSLIGGILVIIASFLIYSYADENFGRKKHEDDI